MDRRARAGAALVSDGGARSRSCPTCGALNGSDFDRCVRCGMSLSAISTSIGTVGWGREIDGKGLLATKILAGMTLLVFAGQVLATMARGLDFPVMSSGSPVEDLHFGAIFTSPELVAAEPWRLLSAVFVHFGALHIGMNLFALVSLSRAIEPAIGSARFMTAYVVTGIASFATTMALGIVMHDPPSLTAGASGAIFGVMGVLLGVLWRRRDPRWKGFAVRAVLFSIMLGFGLNASKSGILVNNSAHVGGVVCGVLFGLVYGAPRRRASDIAVNVGALAALLACVASLLLARASPLWREVEREEATPSASSTGDEI